MTFAEWIRFVANTLGLTEWSISYTSGDVPDDVIAQVIVPHGRREAGITLGAKFYADDPSNQRETIVHELLHCHFADLDELQRDSLPSLIGQPAFTVYENAVDLVIEHGIDALSVAIAASGVIPLPPDAE
jgi:hypothetical protein